MFAKNSFFQKVLTAFQRILRPHFFLFLGLGLISAWVLLQVHSYTKLSFSQSYDEAVVSGSVPQRVTIPVIDVDLDVFPTAVRGNIWEISDKGVSYLETSQRPGSRGNTIMYAHNTKDRLARLTELVKGDEIQVVNDDGVTITYVVYKTAVVAPNDIDTLFEFVGDTLTVYSCTGFLDTQRIVVKALSTEELI